MTTREKSGKHTCAFNAKMPFYIVMSNLRVAFVSRMNPLALNDTLHEPCFVLYIFLNKSFKFQVSYKI